MTLQMPFSDIKSYPQVILTIHASGHPARPGQEATERGLTDHVWNVMTQCWARNPIDRPSAADVLAHLKNNA